MVNSLPGSEISEVSGLIIAEIIADGTIAKRPGAGTINESIAEILI